MKSGQRGTASLRSSAGSRAKRPLLAHALSRDLGKIEQGLKEEESAEREKDRLYWRPLRSELERMRALRRSR